MNRRLCLPPRLALAALLLAALLPRPLPAGAPTKRDALAHFEKQVRPLLTAKCLRCHGPDKQRGGLDLGRRATAVAGGESGPAFVPGKPLKSLLYEKVAGGKMPPGKPLSPAEVAVLKQWLADGAPYPSGPLVAARPGGAVWWSLRPVRRPALPRTRFDHLAANPIDRFVFARLEPAGLRPSPPADRLALLRRVTFDLTGLPPTPEEVTAFLADLSP